MSGRTNGSCAAAGGVPVADRPAAVRNVVLVGRQGAGKTTLVEYLAAAAGAIGRAGRVEDGTTVSDHDPAEHRHHRSVRLSVVPVGRGHVKVNLVDTPGSGDFVGELRAGMRAADAALFVLPAGEAVGGATRAVWEECAAAGLPRAIVVTRLEAARTGFDAVVDACAAAFGGGDPEAVPPLCVPRYGEPGADGHRAVHGLLAPVHRLVVDHRDGTRRTREPEGELRARLEECRDRLIEAVIGAGEDEALLERYLAGAALTPRAVFDALRAAVARGAFFPVLPVAPPPRPGGCAVGVQELLELVAEGFPSPEQRPVPPVTAPDGAPVPPPACDPRGPLLAEVIRTDTDPYVGRVSLLRVFSGTLRPDAAVHVGGHGPAGRTGRDRDHEADERAGALATPFGGRQVPVPRCVAGDLCTVAKLSGTATGGTVSDRGRPLLLAPWTVPEPLFPVAVEARSRTDDDRLAQALARSAAEDPALRVEQNPDTGQLVLWCVGEAHAEVLLERLAERYGVHVDAVPHRVALRETFHAAARGRGRHVKQSGGHGQYAVCEVAVEPLPGGAGVEFAERIVGGAVPRQFVPSVEKGVRAQCARGVAQGGPLVDVRVTLVDGKAHPVDSSDAAFQTAGALALRAAADAARIDVLEPVAEVCVLVEDADVGAVLADLAGRRGRVLGTDPSGPGRTRVRAEVPESGIGRYPVELRALSHGTGRFSRRYVRHERMPARARAAEPAG